MDNMFKPISLALILTTILFSARNQQVNNILLAIPVTTPARPSMPTPTQLPQQGDNVSGILEEKNGNLWFSTTNNGVYRYDGKSFKNFTIKDGLKNNAVLAMLQDKNGNIWFGTFSGLSVFDGKLVTDVPGANFSLVYSMLEDKTGTLWFSTNNGVYWYNGSAFNRFLDNKSVINKDRLELGRVNRMLADKKGDIWFTTCTEGVCRYDGKSIESYKPNNEEYFRGLLEDHDGNIWVGGRNTGVSRFNGKTFTSVLQKGVFDSCIAYSIIQDKAGKIWFGTEATDDSNRKTAGGIWVYNGTTFKNFLMIDGLTHNAVWSLIQDRAGNIWAGTRAGLCRYDGKTFSSISE